MIKKIIFTLLLALMPSLAFADSGLLLAENGFFVDAFNFIVSVGSVLIGLLGMLAGWLLSPDWTVGSQFNMQVVLKNLWILVSNVVYIIFGGILVWIAFMNIIGAEGETYQLKTALPKFAVGIIIVPFTWFIVQFILSISTILTASVMQLPLSVFNIESADFGSAETIPTNCEVDFSKKSATEIYESIGCSGTPRTIKQVLSEGPYSIMSVYTYDIFSFQDIDKIQSNGGALQKTGEVVSIAVGAAIKTIIFLAYFILLIALCFALFLRAVWTWLFAIFSPLFGLFHFFGKTPESMSSFSFKEFISLALVPVYVGGALAFGAFFLKTVETSFTKQVVNEPAGCSGNSSGYELRKDEDGNSLICNDERKILTIKGGLWESAGLSQEAEGPGIIAKIIIDIIGLIVIWLTVMAGLRHSEITKGIVEPFYSFGTKMGELAASLPKHTPIMPGGLDLRGLSQVPTSIKGALETKSAAKFEKFENKFTNNNKDKHKAGMQAMKRSTDAKSFFSAIDKEQSIIKTKGLNSTFGREFQEKLKDKLNNDTRLKAEVYGVIGVRDPNREVDTEVIHRVLSGGNEVMFSALQKGEYNKSSNNFSFQNPTSVSRGSGGGTTGLKVGDTTINSFDSGSGNVNVNLQVAGKDDVNVQFNFTNTLRSNVSTNEHDKFFRTISDEAKTGLKEALSNESDKKGLLKQIVKSVTGQDPTDQFIDDLLDSIQKHS